MKNKFAISIYYLLSAVQALSNDEVAIAELDQVHECRERVMNEYSLLV